MPSAAGSPAPLLLVLGEEQLLIDRAISGAVRAARKVDPEVERREAAAAGLSPLEFSDLVAPSLFAEPRVVVIRQAHESSKEIATAIAEYAGEPVEGVVLVVQHNGGARNKALADGLRKAGAAVMTCNKITKPAERIEFVRHEIRSAGGTTTPDAVAAIVDAVGSDLRELASAASQLVADTGGLVDESAVRKYHRGRAEVSGFTVADLAVAGDVPGALEALRWTTSVGRCAGAGRRRPCRRRSARWPRWLGPGPAAGSRWPASWACRPGRSTGRARPPGTGRKPGWPGRWRSSPI